MKSWTSFSLILTFCGFLIQSALAEEKVSFSDSELALIRSHGPWPVPTNPDPSNRFSGSEEAIRWGEQLFNDTRLSGEGNLSCASCHQQELSFSDGLTRSTGTTKVDRNTIALANLRLNRWFGWAGRSDTLWAQSIHPLLDSREMNATAHIIADRVINYEDLKANYQALIGINPLSESPENLMVNIAKILAAFQETIQTPPSKFDQLRRAVTDGASIETNQAIVRGLKLFVGRGKCSLCHFGPNFTNGEFHDIGLPYFLDNGEVDTGRYGGIELLRKSPYNRAGAYSDEPIQSAENNPSYFMRLQHRNWGEFRVPSLRNVSKTAPYMHNGTLKTLEDVVHHYSTVDIERLHADGETILQPLNLTDQEVEDLVAFLETL